MNAAWNCLLALGSLALGLVLAESTLRVFHHRYGELAEPPARDAESAYMLRHPDTGVPHAVVHNNLGSRQHRNFSERDLAEGVNIAFFGDSFTENTRLPAPYSFTEPLDYLLNAHPSEGGSRRVNILNFGVGGSGPGRQYIRYRGLPFRHRLRHVFYVHCSNDLGDLHRSAQWALDGTGRLVRRLRDGAAAWPRVLSGLHLAYLVLDVWHRLDIAGRGPGEPAVLSESDTWRVFDALLRQWRLDVEAAGGVFHVVLLPRPPKRPDHARARWRAALASWNVVDLRACFAAAVAGYRYRNYRFASDGHWNAAGNMVAAHCLYRRLEAALGLPRRPDEAVAKARHAYYSAFRDSDSWQGQRFMPGPPWALPGDAAPGAIERYLALGDEVAEPLDKARLAAWRVIARSAPAVRSRWNVHARRSDRELAYLKAPCSVADTYFNFFLRVRPADDDRFLPVPIGFGDGGPHPVHFDGKCLLTVPLPAWPIGTIWTGGSRPDNSAKWMGKFHWDLDGLRRAARAAAERQPAASGAFAIYHARGALTYVRSPCAPSDVRRRFFLHVFDGTGRRESLDFDFVDRGALVDGKCVALARLPDGGGSARVHTGQFDSDHGEIWRAEFAVGEP